MSANYLTYAAFALICLVLLTLPFVPAYREWRHPSDIAALPISPNYSSDIDHFARRLKADATAKLGVGMPTGYEDFDFVSHPVESMDWSRAAKRLISPGSIDTSVAIRNTRPIYVEGDIRAGAESAWRAQRDQRLGSCRRRIAPGAKQHCPSADFGRHGHRTGQRSLV